MKGLDTSVLLEILEGRPSGKKLLAQLAGEELCTTEANMLELAAIARSLSGPALERRLAALDHLRLGLTVLPMDAKATAAAAAKWKEAGQGLPAIAWHIFGALEANGCSEWITSRSAGFPKVATKLKVTRRAD